MNQAKATSMHSELELTMERKYAMPESVPCVVIVGGGFAGLAAARALKKAAVRIILIDRTNHTSFSLCSIKWRQQCLRLDKSVPQSGRFCEARRIPP